jgi:hypothetical protein
LRPAFIQYQKMENILPEEIITNKIYLIRGQKIMLDRDLAELYGVETKRLKEQVRRNIERFPERYMFEMTTEELSHWRSHFATSNEDRQGLRHLPFCFTEHGILQLSNILKSERAIKVSFFIIDIFVKLREVLSDSNDIWLQIERIKSKLDNQDRNMELIFKYIDEVMDRQSVSPPRTRIGYKPDELD